MDKSNTDTRRAFVKRAGRVALAAPAAALLLSATTRQAKAVEAGYVVTNPINDIPL